MGKKSSWPLGKPEKSPQTGQNPLRKALQMRGDEMICQSNCFPVADGKSAVRIVRGAQNVALSHGLTP